jgi:hypothetical protein
MKLVIYTQYQENYGAHDWDGEGACPQYWKMKGGSTFVVEGLTAEQARGAVESGCPTLRGLIEYRNEGSREDVVDVIILADDDVVGEPWETPTKLTCKDGQWVASEVEENGEYGYMRREIARKSAEWVMLPGGERKDFRVMYTMSDGRVVDHAGLEQALVA